MSKGTAGIAIAIGFFCCAFVFGQDPSFTSSPRRSFGKSLSTLDSRPLGQRFSGILGEIPPGNKVAIICFGKGIDPKMEDSCVNLRARFQNECGSNLDVVLVEGNQNTYDQIEQQLKDAKLPQYSLVFVKGHGTTLENGEGTAEHWITSLPKSDHFISQRVVETSLLLSKINSAIDSPSIIVNSCKAGTACRNSTVCVGSVCGDDQKAYGNPFRGHLNFTEELLVSLYCHPEAFRAFDSLGHGEQANNAVIDPEEFADLIAMERLLLRNSSRRLKGHSPQREQQLQYGQEPELSHFLLHRPIEIRDPK